LTPHATVIYYTSNRENEAFEGRIRRSIRHASKGLPIISVSQKPIDFGTNICVGDVGTSGHNAWRQFQMGVLKAKTKYICPAEADTIYPKEYFSFVPPRDDTYYLAPLYVCFCQRGYGKYFAWKPRGSESSMVVNRELLLGRLEKMFEGRGMWGPTEDFMWLLDKQRRTRFNIPIPVVTFKTDENMHRKTPHKVDDRTKDLPGYGNVRDLIRRYRG
jgi:hypothetical protein